MSKAFIQKISVPFNPTRITGCQLWLDALDPFGNGSIQNSPLTLTSWIDKSSSARHATMFNGTNISYSPTAFNNRPAFLFTQTQNMSAPAAAGTFPSIFTFFIIYHRTSGVSYDALLTRGVGNIAGPFDFYTSISTGNFSRNIGGPTAGYYDFNTTSGSNFTNVTTPSLYYANITTANGVRDAFNFVTPTDPSAGTLLGNLYVDVATAIYIGTRADSVTRLTASVAEIIVYSTTPTVQQRQEIEGYLAQKWGLTANLPPGHPGLTQTIYTSNYNAKNPGSAITPSRAMTNLPYTNLFSPTSSSIGACQLWLDGADTAGTGTAPANGATVSTWVDKSGNGRNAVAVVAGTYSSAQRSIAFTGTNYYNSSYTAAPTSETLFIVFNMTTNNNPFLIASSTCGGRVADPTELLVFTGGAICYTNGAATTAVVTLGSNTLGIVVTDGTNNYVSLHGALMLSGPVSVSYTGGTTTQIGGAVGANYLTNGFINEVIAYNSVLGTTQRQLVEGYLAWKWGLTSSLPSTHPFKSVPPGRPSQVAGIPVQVKMSAIRVVQLQYSGTYTTSGNFFATFTGNGSVTVLSPVTINYFAIGGGGGGGSGPGGGGGAGGLQMGSMNLSVGTYNIVIGAGGPAHTNGSNTTFGTTLVVALGGGFGADGYPSTETGGSGGCGGGRGSSTAGAPGTGTQGYNGGNTAGAGSGGGGGVGGVGETSPNTSNVGGAGGIGVLYYGTYYGGGGGGAPNHGASTGFAGAGGLGGGGRGGQNGLPILDPVAGTPNTGGGGGGGRSANQYSGPGAAGGSGVFIISY
jgi:hypothetical protein